MLQCMYICIGESLSKSTCIDPVIRIPNINLVGNQFPFETKSLDRVPNLFPAKPYANIFYNHGVPSFLVLLITRN